MIIIHSDRVLGKASLTQTKCWVSGSGLGEVSQVELKPQWGLFWKEKRATVSAVLGGLESPGDGGGRGRPRLRQAL